MQVNKDSMTYEERRKIEEQENIARDLRQTKLLAEVATYLPQGWVFQDRNRVENRPWWHFKNDSIQGDIWIGQEWNAKDKLSITGNYPKDRQGHTYDNYEQSRPSISFSSTRTALAIAKDIERRFLPDYLKLLDKIKTRIREHESYLDRKQSLGAALKAALPYLKLSDETQGKDYWGHDRTGNDVKLSCNWAEIKCYDTGRADLDLQELTAAEIIYIVDYLHKSRDGEEE